MVAFIDMAGAFFVFRVIQAAFLQAVN